MQDLAIRSVVLALLDGAIPQNCPITRDELPVKLKLANFEKLSKNCQAENILL